MDGFIPPDLQQVLGRIEQIAERFAPPPAPGSAQTGRAGASSPPTGAFGAALSKAATASSLDPKLVEAVMEAESGGNPDATSSKGAMGLMQLMPETARDLGVSDPYDPQQNLDGGARYLRQMLDQFGDLPKAIAAYNAGPNAVSKADGIPPFPETQHYVKEVLDRYRQNLAQ